VTRQLLPDFPGHFVSCAFKDDKTLIYLADRGTETVIGSVAVDGSNNKELLPQRGQVVTSLVLSKEGNNAALLVQSASHPSEVFAWDLAGEPRALTESNPWLHERRLGTQELVHWKARDGLQLDGVLIRPLDEKAGTKYPLIMVVHGGPEAHNRNGWLT